MQQRTICPIPPPSQRIRNNPIWCLEATLLLRSLSEKLTVHDGFSSWRLRETKDLRRTVQEALTRLQNPENCSEARKLVCHLTWGGCGLGCLLHHTAYCLVTSLATGRVLVLSDQVWPHSNLVLRHFFRNISNTCTDYAGKKSSIPKSWDLALVGLFQVLRR